MVVIGFEQDVYVVFEGQQTQVCVAVLNRALSTDDQRLFMVATEELSQDPAKGQCVCIYKFLIVSVCGSNAMAAF